MSGNENQYDPSKMFRDWIQQNGKAQSEFIENFGRLLSTRPFDPVTTLRDISAKIKESQSNIFEGMSSAQRKNIDTMFSMGQMLPSILNWGAYKTTISSNGRISIPEAERNALGLGEGDLIQVIILPLGKKNREVKE